MSIIFEQQSFSDGNVPDFSIGEIKPGHIFCLNDALYLKTDRTSFNQLFSGSERIMKNLTFGVLQENETLEMLDYVPLWRSLVSGSFAPNYGTRNSFSAKACIAGFEASQNLSSHLMLNYGDFFFLPEDIGLKNPFMAINCHGLAISFHDGKWHNLAVGTNIRTAVLELSIDAVPEFIVSPFVNEILNGCDAVIISSAADA